MAVATKNGSGKVEEHTTDNKRKVVHAALRVLDIEKIGVDTSYQRDLKGKHKRIVADFNPDALGILLVGERGDGSLWMVDGLQRWTALKKLGHKTVRAEVFRSKGPEHEAGIFKLINLNRTKLTPGEEFRALLTAGDELAWKIKETVEACGYYLVLGRSGNNSPNSRSRQLAAVNTLFRVAKRQGTDPIKFALDVVKVSWPDDPLATTNLPLLGLMMFYARHEGAVDSTRLIPRLQQVTPHKIIYTANQMTIANNKGAAVADVIEKVYAKRLKTK